MHVQHTKKGRFLSSSSSIISWILSLIVFISARGSPATCPFLDSKRQRCHPHLVARWLALALLTRWLVFQSAPCRCFPQLATVICYIFHMKYVDVRHRCIACSLLIEAAESVIFLSSVACSSSLLPMTSSASAMGTFGKSEVTLKLTRILSSSSLMLVAFSTKSPESLMNADV